MSITSIYQFTKEDLSTSGRAIGAITNNRFKLPVLKTLLELGRDTFHSNSEIYEYLRPKINLNEVDFIKTGSTIEWEYRIKWALNQLKNAELIDKDYAKEMSWKLNVSGESFLAEFDLINSTEIEQSKIEEARKKVDILVIQKQTKPKVRFWAGGFNSDHSRLKEFIDNNFWQALDYDENDQGPTAKEARLLFSNISVGDKFLIKGFGGRSDLKVYYVGTVLNKDDEIQRIDLERDNVDLYVGKAPTGAGAGNWFNTLIEIKRAQDIAQLFGNQQRALNAEFSTSEKQHHMVSANTIFYGPPGTGKTFRMQQLIKDYNLENPIEEGEKDYRNFAAEYRWWEIVAMALLNSPGRKAKVPELMAHPLVQAKFALGDIQNPRARLWSTLQNHTVDTCPNVKLKKRHGEQIFFKDTDSTWSIFDFDTFSETFELLVEEFNDFLEGNFTGPQKRYLFTTCHQSLSYEDFIEGIKPMLVSDDGDEDGSDEKVKYEIRKGYFYNACNLAAQLAGYSNLTACINATYEDRKQKIKEAIDKKRVFFVFLDEINRCNISAVFGELITLIEDNKRLGAKNEISDTILPYSQKAFGVPANLYIVGTMNTADRSVEALDSALRRRFSFEEMKPLPWILSPQYAVWRLWWDYSHVGWQNQEYIERENRLVAFLGIPATQNVESIKENVWAQMKREGMNEDQVSQFESWPFNGFNLQILLETLNERIAYLKDADHQIGHSYFLGVDSFESLKRVFKDSIIPLMKEYFYNDYEKILWILGAGFVKVHDTPPKFATNTGEDLGRQIYTFANLDENFDIRTALKLTMNEPV